MPSKFNSCFIIKLSFRVKTTGFRFLSGLLRSLSETKTVVSCRQGCHTTLYDTCDGRALGRGVRIGELPVVLVLLRIFLGNNKRKDFLATKRVGLHKGGFKDAS